MDRRYISDDVGWLPAITVGTLFVFYVILGAMHDIAHGESDTTFEYAALMVSVPAFAFLYRMALSHLPPKQRVVWLFGVGLLILLVDLGAINAELHPKYTADPMLASIFLAAGVPVLGLIGFHISRENFRRRNRPGA